MPRLGAMSRAVRVPGAKVALSTASCYPETCTTAFQMAADFGAVVGPLAAGALADSYSYGAAFAATAGVVALGFVAALFSTETRRREPA